VAILVISLPASQWAVIVFGGLFGGWIAVRMLAKLLPAGILRARRGQPAVLACRLLATSTFMGVDGFVPLAADRIHGASPMAQGFTIIGAALTWTGGQALIARRPDVKPQHAVRLGFSILGLGVLLVVPVLWSGWPLWATFLGWAVGGIGMGVLYNPTTVAAMSYAVEGSEGDTGGQMQLVDSLGFSLMGGVGGAVVAFADRSSFALSDAIGICFGLAFACAVLGAFAARGVRAATPGSTLADLVVEPAPASGYVSWQAEGQFKMSGRTTLLTRRRALCAVGAALTCAVASVGLASTSTVPAGAAPVTDFLLETRASGFTVPTDLAFAPNGLLFVAEKSGLLKVVNGTFTTVFADLRSEVNDAGERVARHRRASQLRVGRALRLRPAHLRPAAGGHRRGQRRPRRRGSACVPARSADGQRRDRVHDDGDRLVDHDPGRCEHLGQYG
jgi:hypothetical protein